MLYLQLSNLLNNKKFSEIEKIYQDNKSIIDIFAGSGLIGLEAISRGINQAYFYENNPEVIKILKQNCIKICKDNRYEIIENDVMIVPPKKTSLPISLIYIDPPYNTYDISELLLQLIKKNIIEKNTVIAIETHIEDNFMVIEKFKVIEQRSYGKTSLYFIKLST